MQNSLPSELVWRNFCYWKSSKYCSIVMLSMILTVGGSLKHNFYFLNGTYKEKKYAKIWTACPIELTLVSKCSSQKRIKFSEPYFAIFGNFFTNLGQKWPKNYPDRPNISKKNSKICTVCIIEPIVSATRRRRDFKILLRLLAPVWKSLI